MEDESVPTHKRAALWIFDQLLRQGIIAYTPLLNVEGVDAVIRCEDGRYRDLHIRASAGEHDPLWFQVRNIEPRDNLYIVCVAWALSPIQCWIIPSGELVRYGHRKGSVIDLNLEAAAEGEQKLKAVMSVYRNAWRFLTDGALKPYPSH